MADVRAVRRNKPYVSALAHCIAGFDYLNDASNSRTSLASAYSSPYLHSTKGVIELACLAGVEPATLRSVVRAEPSNPSIYYGFNATTPSETSGTGTLMVTLTSSRFQP